MAKKRKAPKRERCDLGPLIDAVQDSLDRLQVTWEGRGAAECFHNMTDLHMVIGDLEDAIDKAGE